MHKPQEEQFVTVTVEAFAPNYTVRNLRALQAFALSIPDEKLHMDNADFDAHGRGCVLCHIVHQRALDGLNFHTSGFGKAVDKGIDDAFDVFSAHPYSDPTGAAGKAEFIRRIDALIQLAA